MTRAFSPYRAHPVVGHRQPGELVTAELLGRITGTLAIVPYEMELFPDGSFQCLEFTGLASVLGPLPAGSSPEQAYDSAVHPEDRQRYDAVCEALNRGEAAEVEYRLVGYDGRTRWVLDRMQPRRTDDGRVSSTVSWPTSPSGSAPRKSSWRPGSSPMWHSTTHSRTSRIGSRSRSS